MSNTPAVSIYESTFAPSNKTDAILVVDGKKLHVNKALLSCHSDYFNTLFNADFAEKSMPEIPIKDVKYEEFVTLLSLVHPNPIKPTESNCERLLTLAEQFLLPAAKRHVELYIMSTTKGGLDKVRIADKHQLDDLLNNGISMFTTAQSFTGLIRNSVFNSLSDRTKVALLIRGVALMGY